MCSMTARQLRGLRKYLWFQIINLVRFLIVSSEAHEVNHMLCICNVSYISRSLLPVISSTSFPEYHENHVPRPLERITSQQRRALYPVAEPTRWYRVPRLNRYHTSFPSHTRNLNAFSHLYRRRRRILFRNRFLYILQFPLPVN
jgi:hypothetical protein